VEGKINEVDITTLITGMETKVTVDSLPGQVYTGVVDSISPVAVESGDGIRTFELVAVLGGQVKGLRPGMTANLTFCLGVATQALSVPLASVFCDDYEAAMSDQEFYLYAETPTGFVKRTVQVGRSDFERIQIVSGITANTTVAIERPSPEQLLMSSSPQREGRGGGGRRGGRRN
jgi:multidrug efflux pump subunit AcrA (membrane-fusion protein)